MKNIQKAKDKLSAYLFIHKEVIRVGVTEYKGEEVLVVKISKDLIGIPKQFEGFKVIKEITKKPGVK